VAFLTRVWWKPLGYIPSGKLKAWNIGPQSFCPGHTCQVKDFYGWHTVKRLDWHWKVYFYLDFSINWIVYCYSCLLEVQDGGFNVWDLVFNFALDPFNNGVSYCFSVFTDLPIFVCVLSLQTMRYLDWTCGKMEGCDIFKTLRNTFFKIQHSFIDKQVTYIKYWARCVWVFCSLLYLLFE